MLSHKIRRKDKPEVAKQVSEFAWRKKYEKTGLWEIIPGKTLGKPAGAPLPPQLPPTQFAPPQVVQLRAGVQSVEASEGLGQTPVDPIGLGETEPVITEVNSGNAEEPAPKKRGRPKKVEA